MSRVSRLRRPRQTMLKTIFSLALLLFACGTASPTPAARQPVGGACNDDTACEADLYCETRLPGGACTYACEGSTCPLGSHCIEVTWSVGGVPQSAIRCLQDCDSGRVCRSGWRCVQADPDPYSVCFP